MTFSLHSPPHAFLSLVLLVCLFAGCGKSGVKGKVLVNDSPVAAGTITFSSKDEPKQKLVGTISNGSYKIESKVVPGEYDVKIDIHFANGNDAEAFYANMTKELNKEKILHGDTPELVLDSEDGQNEDDTAKPKVESPLKSHVFQSNLTGGSNVHDFNIDQ